MNNTYQDLTIGELHESYNDSNSYPKTANSDI